MTRFSNLTGLLAISLILGCGSPSEDPSIPRVRIAAASDLQTVLPKIIEQFRAKHPIDVQPVFGASGQLAKQIGQGGPFDLFLSANRTFVEDLVAKGAIDRDSVHPYTRGILAVAVNPNSGVEVKSLADLARPEVKKIAIANPAFAPYGIAAMQAIERGKLKDVVAPKLVMADSVRHAFQFVQTGNAEAGLIADSVMSGTDLQNVYIYPTLYDAIIQYLGVVAQSKHKESAGLFADFLRGEEGQAILKKAGFARVETAWPDGLPPETTR